MLLCGLCAHIDFSADYGESLPHLTSLLVLIFTHNLYTHLDLAKTMNLFSSRLKSFPIICAALPRHIHHTQAALNAMHNVLSGRIRSKRSKTGSVDMAHSLSQHVWVLQTWLNLCLVIIALP